MTELTRVSYRPVPKIDTSGLYLILWIEIGHMSRKIFRTQKTDGWQERIRAAARPYMGRVGRISVQEFDGGVLKNEKHFAQ